MNQAASRKGLSRSSNWLSLVAGTLVVITIAASALTILDLRTDVIASYKRDMRNLGVVIAEQTARSLQAVDLVVQEAREKVLATGVETPEQFNRLTATEEIHRFLKERLKNLPQADAIILVGADGRVVNLSRSWPTPVIDLTDREHYAYLRDHDDLEAYISEPVKSRATGEWTVYLSRRVDGPHGEFLGAVLGAIKLRYFEDFFAAVTLHAGGSVLVLRRDGTFVARYPPIESQIGKRMPAESPWYPLVEEGGGTYRSPGYIDGFVRVVSVHPLRDYPLVVDVTVAEEEALAQWRRQSTFIALFALCTIAGFIVLFRLLAVQFRRLESRTAELVQTTAALRENEARFRDFATTSSDWFWEQDENLRYTFISDASGTHDMSSVEQQRNVVDIRVPDEQRAAHEADVAARRPFRDYFFERLGTDDDVRHVSISGTPVFDEAGIFRGYRGTGRNRTAEVHAEETRRSLEQQLQHAQRIEALGQLAGGVAHDLNNALVPVLGLTELVLEGTPKGSGDRALLETVLASAVRARELVRQILTFSRREQSDRHAFDLGETAAETLAMLRAAIPSSIAVVDDIAPALPMVGDPGKLQQVLTNLVMNAAQAIGDRHGTITVLAQLEGDGSHIRLTVADTGCGIDAATADHIFEPFFTTKEVGKGTGLGLSIVHGIVSSHDGTIVVESAPGQGTRFEIVLPTGVEPAAPMLLRAG
jgi:signal transduction histidine kinase